MKLYEERVAAEARRMAQALLDERAARFAGAFGENAVERGHDEVRVRARGLTERRLAEPELRFLPGAGR